MWLLIHYKVKVGARLGSRAILADAACTRACLRLSIVLLISSVGYELTGIGGIDSVGTIVIAGLCYREGKEPRESKGGELRPACAAAAAGRTGNSAENRGHVSLPYDRGTPLWRRLLNL